MDASSAKYLFQKRNEKLDWRKLASVDVERIARDVDVDAIQENIVNVTYCNVEHELGYHGIDGNVIKLFRLAQLTIEYLLHSQEFLQKCLGEKDTKLASYDEKLNNFESQCDMYKDELTKKRESYKDLKKELQKAKKLIGDYQLMVRSGASGLFKCPQCTKSFVSEYYLKCHMERRHSDEIKSPPTAAPVSVASLQDEAFLSELSEIKNRLKSTEEELRKEHDNVHRLNLKEAERSREILEILRQQELQKNEEKEQIKMELAGYREMMMNELRETQRENEELKKDVTNLHDSTEAWKKANMGSSKEDSSVSMKVYNDLQTQVKELTHELTATSKENESLRNEVNKWKASCKKLLKDDNKYKELLKKLQMLESTFQSEFDSLSVKYAGDFEETKEFCREYVRNNLPKVEIKELATDVPDAKRPLPVPADVTVWVSSNTSIVNCYRVSLKPSHEKGDWSDVCSFKGTLAPTSLCDQPVYVYSCDGPPYWRQFVSLQDIPPTRDYKKEMTLYISSKKLPEMTTFFILDIGGGTVVRSMLSLKESIKGWREKGEFFYARLISKVNRSLTFNSDVFQSVSDDDEVSLSSLTRTDVAKGDLVDDLKQSRENLDSLAVDENAEDDVFSEELVGKDVEEEDKENQLFGTSSSVFSTLREKGEYFLFPENTLAVAKFRHLQEMISAQREELITILNDTLVRRGIDTNQMPTPMLSSKMRKHEKELQLLEKQTPGCMETRKRILTSIENYVENKPQKSRRANSVEIRKPSILLSNTNQRASVRFSDQITPLKQQPDSKSSKAVTSTPKVPPPPPTNFNGQSQESESESDYDSADDLEFQLAQSINNRESVETMESDQVYSRESVETMESDQSHKLELPQGITSAETINTTNKPPLGDHTPRLSSKNLDEESNSSDWDSEEDDQLSLKHLEESFEPEELYNPKLRPPTGDNVKKLTASLELTLGSRDPSKKKVAGAVDLHPADTW